MENMIIKPEVANKALIKKGLPFRVVTVRCKRIEFDIPWENMSYGQWKLEVDGLHVVLEALERESWAIGDLLKAKESAVQTVMRRLPPSDGSAFPAIFWRPAQGKVVSSSDGDEKAPL